MDGGTGPLAEGRRLLDEGRFDEAVLAVRGPMDDGDPEALVVGSTALRRAGRARPALAAASRALEVRPAWGPALAAVAAATAARGRAADADRAAQTALSLAPGDPDVWNAAGLAALAGRDRAEAERCFRHGLTLDPGHHEMAEHLRRLESPSGDPGPELGEGNAVGRWVRRSWYVSTLPERAEDDHRPPVPLVAWWGLAAVVAGVAIFVLLGR